MLDQLVSSTPAGKTPICEQIRQVTASVRAQADELRSKGKKAVVVIATDGVSTDGDLTDVMRPFEQLPVWVVVRLCTDDDAIVRYWNDIDAELELELDVLDDFASEAEEVVGNNAWLTYGMPLHRLREWGSANKLFDLIDETKFTPSQVRDMVALVFGKDACRQLPLPEVDLHGFIAEVELLQKGEPMTWCPLTKRCTAWFIPHKLRSLKSGGSGGSKLRRAWRSAISKVRGEIKGSKAK
jgi:hypothetical protein